MKSKQTLKQSWATLATAPEFEDCLQDLLRYVGFWKPLDISTASGDKCIAELAQRRVITYILKQTEYPSIEVDMSAPERESN